MTYACLCPGVGMCKVSLLIPSSYLTPAPIWPQSIKGDNLHCLHTDQHMPITVSLLNTHYCLPATCFCIAGALAGGAAGAHHSGSDSTRTASTGNGASGYGSNAGTEGTSTAAKAKTYIPGTAENQASRGSGNSSSYSSQANASGFNSGSSTTASGLPGTTGATGATGTGLSTGKTDTFGNEQAPQQGNTVYNADAVPVSAYGGNGGNTRPALGGSGTTSGTGSATSGYGSGNNPGSGNQAHASGNTGSGSGTGGGGVKSHIPGTEQYKESHGQGSTGNTGYSNTSGFGDSNNRGNFGSRGEGKISSLI